MASMIDQVRLYVNSRSSVIVMRDFSRATTSGRAIVHIRFPLSNIYEYAAKLTKENMVFNWSGTAGGKGEGQLTTPRPGKKTFRLQTLRFE